LFEEEEGKVGTEVKGHESRQERAKRLSRASRTQTARAMDSRGRLARLRIAWTRGTEGVAREAAAGMRLTRWMAGPAHVSSG